MARLKVREATLTASEATQVLTGEKLLIRLIDAGQGSSGYYPAETLEAAAAANVFPAGTQMFIDHPGEEESVDRPERTLKDLAAVLDEDAYYDPETQALVAEATVFKKWREDLKEKAEKKAMGVSIRAFAEFDGNVVTRLIEAISVDFVTNAGRGGKVLSVLESKRVNEDLESNFSERLSQALADQDEEAYVRDYDKESGIAYIYAWKDQKYYGASFEDSATEVTLSEDWYEVFPETHYIRVGSSAESKEIEVADSLEVVTEAKTAAEARVVALEAENAALKLERDQLAADKAEKAQEANKARGDEILNRVLGESEIPDVTKDKIRTNAVIGDDFDAVAFEAMLNDEIKRESEYLVKALGSDTVTGFGKESRTTTATGFRTAWGRESK